MKRSPLALPVLCLLAAVPAFAQKGNSDPVLELGRTTYQSCVACHGPDGRGVRAGDLVMAPSLPESAFVKGNHPELLTAIVLKGIRKADQKYVQAMLALEAVLQDEQIAALIAYVTSEFGGTRRAATAEEVARWRKLHASRTSPWKRTDLQEMLEETASPPLLGKVRHRIYTGQWKRLPDFSSLTPVTEGEFEAPLISLEPAQDLKGGFGMVFDAELTIPKTGDYLFSLTSDDGSALIIDGETVVGNDGIHPAKTATMKETLQEGHHTLQVQYFDGGGQRNLALFVKEAGNSRPRWLSVEREAARKAAQSFDPIPLTARNPGEAVLHRAFLPDAKPRAIGVGYPGGLNLVWDADVLNLAYVYRGDFMDAATHWNGRGSGSTPLGTDRVKTAPGLPLQVLESLDEPWQPYSEVKVKYERDTVDPQKEIVLDVRHPDYQFRGYRLDAKRFPTFRYDYRGIEVTDTFRPANVDGIPSLLRTLRTAGNPDENTYLRLLAEGGQAIADGWFEAGPDLKVRIEGAEPVQRTVADRRETLVPVAADATLTITYRWNRPLRSEPGSTPSVP